jgi:hypothetical protein
MSARFLRIAIGMLIAPLTLAAAWSYPYLNHSAFAKWLVINTIMAYLAFTLLAAISHVILRFLRLAAAWQYCLVMFVVAFIVYISIAFVALSGYSDLYYSQTQVVKDGSVTPAGALLQVTESIQGAALLAAVFLVFWFIAVGKPDKRS